jgi:WD40 repeat protein
MCTGRPAFRAPTTVAVLRRVCDETPRPIHAVNPDIPAWLEALIARLHAKAPAERFASAAAVATVLSRRLAELQSGAAVADTAAESGPVARPGRPGRRLRGVALTALLAAAAWAAWYFSTGAPDGPNPAVGDPPGPAPAPVVLHPARTLTQHTDGALAVAFSPNGKVLASAGKDRTILLWDVASWQARGPLTGHSGDVIGLACSPDGARLASVTSARDTCCIRLWDVGTATPAGTLGDPSTGMWAVDWSSDGKLLTCAGWDKVVRVWDVASDAQRLTIPTDAPECVRTVKFSPRADRIITGGGGPTRLWDANTGSEITAAFPPGFLNPSFLPAGDAVACWQYRHGRVTLCDMPSGRVRASWRAHPHLITGLAVSPDGRFLATTGDDGAARVWSTADRTEIATLLGHGGAVYAAAFAPDGARLATVGEADGTVRLWDLPAACRVAR